MSAANRKVIFMNRRATVTPGELVDQIRVNMNAVYKALSRDPILRDHVAQIYLDALSLYHAQQAGERVIAQQAQSLEDIAAQRDSMVDYMTTQRAAIRAQGWHDGRAALARALAARTKSEPLHIMQALEAICSGNVPAGGEDAAALGLEALRILAEMLRTPSEALPAPIQDEGFGI